jgi:hypothetical protein
MSERTPGKDDVDNRDPDGVRVVAGDVSGRRRNVILQLLVLLFAGGCIGYAIMPRSPQPPSPQAKTSRPGGPASPDDAAAASGSGASPKAVGEEAGAKHADATAGAPRRSLTPRRGASKRPAQDPPDNPELEALFPPPAPGEKPREITAGEYIQALHDAGIYEGIGAFNPPGTSPPLEGLAVPEDFPLPEGYVRHYQSTDDGQAIDPILMYSPDYEFFDADGNPVPIPEDRVVREGETPPGFPVRPIVIPPPREPGDLGR